MIDDSRDLDDPFGPPLPERDFLTIFEREDRVPLYGGWRWFVLVRVSEEGPYHGQALLRFYPIPRGPRLGRSSNLARDFIRITRRRPPSRPFRPSWMLEGAEVLARVVTVKARPDRGGCVELPEAAFYSRVDAILRVEVGTPPCLRDKR